MKDCDRCRLLLPDYFDNKLEKKTRLVVSDHILSCPKCAEEYAKIESFDKTLESATDIKLPESLIYKVSVLLEAQNKVSVKTDLRRGLVTHKQQILHFVVIVMYTITILSITAAVIKISFMRDIKNNGSIANLQTSSSLIQPPVSLKNTPKPKQDEPGVGKQENNIGTESFPKPEVSITHAKYDSDNLDSARFQPIVLDFSMAYNAKQVPELLDNYIKISALAANAAGENGTLLASCIRESLRNTAGSALPAYIEKIKFNKRDAWLIVNVWSLNDNVPALSNSSIFILDPVDVAVILKK